MIIIYIFINKRIIAGAIPFLSIPVPGIGPWLTVKSRIDRSSNFKIGDFPLICKSIIVCCKITTAFISLKLGYKTIFIISSLLTVFESSLSRNFTISDYFNRIAIPTPFITVIDTAIGIVLTKF